MTEKQVVADPPRDGYDEIKRLRAANGLLFKLITDCQDALTGYLMPDGYDADKAVEMLLEKLDGPRWRECRDAVLRARAEA